MIRATRGTQAGLQKKLLHWQRSIDDPILRGWSQVIRTRIPLRKETKENEEAGSWASQRQNFCATDSDEML